MTIAHLQSSLETRSAGSSIHLNLCYIFIQIEACWTQGYPCVQENLHRLEYLYMVVHRSIYRITNNVFTCNCHLKYFIWDMGANCGFVSHILIIYPWGSVFPCQFTFLSKYWSGLLVLLTDWSMSKGDWTRIGPHFPGDLNIIKVKIRTFVEPLIVQIPLNV